MTVSARLSVLSDPVRFPPDFGDFAPRVALISTLLPSGGASSAGLS